MTRLARQFRIPISSRWGWFLIGIAPVFIWMFFVALLSDHRWVSEPLFPWLLALPIAVWLLAVLGFNWPVKYFVFGHAMTDAEAQSALDILRASHEQYPETQETRDRGSFSASAAALFIQESQIPWGSITEIKVFKRDLLTTDLICMEILQGELAVLIHEEMPGFDWVVHELGQHLPGVEPFERWFRNVAFPAFEPNVSVIYRVGDLP
ncbi:MAG TPA: hypothetical protein VJ483_03825 [Holophagaceae bacterium]|nr:hypothetical protein [Holophagaceae bacterium]